VLLKIKISDNFPLSVCEWSGGCRFKGQRGAGRWGVCFVELSFCMLLFLRILLIQVVLSCDPFLNSTLEKGRLGIIRQMQQHVKKRQHTANHNEKKGKREKKEKKKMHEKNSKFIYKVNRRERLLLFN